jgi:alanine dehydrogenase
MQGRPLHITERQVAKLLQASDCIRLAREAYIRLAKHRALSPARAILNVPKGASFFAMPAHILGHETVAIKVARLNSSNPARHRPSVMATVYVYDSTTGTELAHIEAETLTAFRTAASSAVAADLLAPIDCETLGIIGAGKQARAHVSAMLKVRSFSQILAYSRSLANRKNFAAFARKTTKIPVLLSDTPEEVASCSQVLVLATNSMTPLFDGRHVRPGTHVSAIGAALPTAREVDTHLVARSFLVVDSISQAVSSYGDIMIPIGQKRITRDDLNELGDLLIHPLGVPRRHRLISLFKSGGIAVLDAAFANLIVSRLIKK